MNVIFAKKNDIKNYPPSKKFINRLENARKDDEIKKSKLFMSRSMSMANTAENTTMVVQVYYIFNSHIYNFNQIQQELNSSVVNFFKKNLHDELHSCILDLDDQMISYEYNITIIYNEVYLII